MTYPRSAARNVPAQGQDGCLTAAIHSLTATLPASSGWHTFGFPRLVVRTGLPGLRMCER